MSKPNDPADNCGSSHCYAAFDGMSWPVPSGRLEVVQWRMRYARESLTPEDLLLAASVICAYSEIVMCDADKRERVAAMAQGRAENAGTKCDTAKGPCACGAWHGDETDGMPIGWTIVATGDDGSVLCRAPNGQRARFWFHGKSA